MTQSTEVKEGYLVGCRPPGLDEKTGAFPHPVQDHHRVSSFVNGAGDLISIDMSTKTLIREGDED